MARAQLKHTVKDRAGNAIQSAAVNVYRPGTATAVYGAMYNAKTGGVTVTNPLISNAQGEVETWLDIPQRVDLQVTDNTDTAFLPSASSVLLSWTTFTETVEILPAVEDLPTMVNVKAYGAVGDGVTDDAAAIQAAIDAAPVGSTIYVPPVSTRYRLLSALSIIKSLRFLGGGTQSLLRWEAAVHGFDCVANAGSIVGLSFANLNIQGNNQALSGIRCTRTSTNEFTMFSMENCLLTGWDTAFTNVGTPFDGVAINSAFEFGHTTSKGVRAQGRLVLIKPWFESLTTGLEGFGNAFITLLEPKWSPNVTTRMLATSDQGFNPVIKQLSLESGLLGTATISVGASPFTYTNNDFVPEAVYIRGGTVSDISKNARTIFTASPATVFLEPGEAVVVTYSAAPTMEKDRK